MSILQISSPYLKLDLSFVLDKSIEGIKYETKSSLNSSSCLSRESFATTNTAASANESYYLLRRLSMITNFDAKTLFQLLDIVNITNRMTFWNAKI